MMFRKFRYFNVVFILALLLGFSPASGHATSPVPSGAAPLALVEREVEDEGQVPLALAERAAGPAALAAATTYTGTATGDARLDFTFDPRGGPNMQVRSLALQPDGKILIGGTFYNYDYHYITGIARINPDGSLDATFNPRYGVDVPDPHVGVVHAIALQPDGKVIIGGYFTTYNDVWRRNIARVNADGSLDTTFDPGELLGGDYYGFGILYALALQPDGKIVIAGDFAQYDGIERNNIARLNADGSLDTTFDPGSGIGGIVGTYPEVRALALQPDGKIIITGDFTTYNGVARRYIARLNANGSLDTTFNPGSGVGMVDNVGFSLALQPDGKIVCGWAGGISRFNPDGSLDPTFSDMWWQGGDTAMSLALQPNGKIIVGGGFGLYEDGSLVISNIARLNTDGSRDTTFNSGLGTYVQPGTFGGMVYALALQPDGKVVLGGEFHYYDGVVRNYLARLNGAAKQVSPFYDVPYHGVLTYTLVLRNQEDQPDPLVVLTDTLPAEVNFVRWLEQPTGATMTNDELHWRGSLAADETITFTFQSQHVGEYGDTVVNHAVYSGTLISGAIQATFWVETPPPLYVGKDVSPWYSVRGETLTYTLKIGNSTAVTLTNVAITDTLPAVLTATAFISDNAALALQPASRYIWSLAELPPGERVYITVTGVIRPDAPLGGFDNTAYIAGVLTETLTYSATATATIVPPTYTLTIAAAGAGVGVVTPTVGSHAIPHHQSVTLYATASPTSAFMGWSGDPDCADGQVLLDADKTCIATFIPMPILTVAVTGTGSGAVSPTVGAHIYPPGTVVTLSATPATSSTFVGWTGDVISPWRPVTVTLDSDKAVTATFNLKPTCNTDVWHVFLGGSGEDILQDMITDEFCNVYVTGTSDRSWGNPVRAHAPITATGDWSMDLNYDAFVAKLDANHNLVWNTFLGGISYDQGHRLALDNAGHLYVGGGTDDRGYGAEWGNPLVDYGHGSRNGFVAQLNAATGALNWNTFIGISTGGAGAEVQVDAAGDIYVYMGGVQGADPAYPVNNLYGTNSIGAQLVKLDASGTPLWGTHIGCGDFMHLEPGNCVLDGSSHLVCQHTCDASWGDPVRPHTGDGSLDAVVTQFNTSDGTLVWHTFLGAAGWEWTYSSSIGVDASDNVYVVGKSSNTWGNPVNPFTVYANWVAKLDVNGALQWNTFTDHAEGAVVDSGGTLYITGGDSATVDGGSTQLDPATAAVLDSARLGGDGGDAPKAIAVDNNDTPLIGGYSYCEWGTPLISHASPGKPDAWVASWGADYGGPPCVAYAAFRKTAEDVNGAPLYAGDLVRYTIALTNTGGLTMTNAVVTDTLPAGLTFVSASPAPDGGINPPVWHLGTVTTGTVWTAVITASVDGSVSYIQQNVANLTCTENCEQSAYASLPSSTVEGFALTMALTGTGSGVLSPTVGIHGYPNGTVVTLTATPDAYSTFDGWSGAPDCFDASVTMTTSKTCTATFTRSATPPALALSKTAEEVNAAPLLVGDRILYTIRVTNTTTGTLTNLIVTDTLPAGVTFFEVPKGPSRPFTRDGQQVVWERGPLAAGASLTLHVIGKATGDPTPIGDNCAAVISAESPTPVSACANLGDPTVQEALTLLKDAVDLNGAPLLVNDVIRYTLYVTNAHATVTMTHVVVTDTLPAGTVFVSATQPYTEAAGVLWWQVGNLAPGASWTAAVDQRVTGAVNPIAGNIAAVWSDQQDWQATGEVTPPDPVIQTALKVSKTAAEHQNAPPLLVGDRILYTLHVTNTTAGALTNLVITDTLPAGVSFYNVPKSSQPFTRNGQQVVWERGPLAAGASLTLEVIGKVDGTVNPIGVNHVVATCAEEAIPAAATAQVPGDGVHAPGLVVTGTVGGGTPRRQAASAGTWVYAVAVTNTNPTHTMHNVVVSATLPSGATFVSATPAGYTGVTTLTWTLATLGPGAVWQGSITVTQTGTLGDMALAAASDEQSPVEAVIAAPGGAEYRIYLPLVIRE